VHVCATKLVITSASNLCPAVMDRPTCTRETDPFSLAPPSTHPITPQPAVQTTDQTSDEAQAVAEECRPCVDTLNATYQCVEANQDTCELSTCYSTSSSSSEDIDYGSCCPECATELETTVGCFTGCLEGTCVNSTATAYVNCLSGDPVCAAKCYSAAQSYADDIEDENVDYTDLDQVNATAQSTSCSDLQSKYQTDACDGYASCCPSCSSEFDDVANCVLNDVLGVALGLEECQLQCSTSRRWLSLLLQGGTGGGAQEQKKRSLQQQPSAGSLQLNCNGILSEQMIFGGYLNSGDTSASSADSDLFSDAMGNYVRCTYLQNLAASSEEFQPPPSLPGGPSPSDSSSGGSSDSTTSSANTVQNGHVDWAWLVFALGSLAAVAAL